MSQQHPSLLKQRRFLPYFVTQFFGAFNDNIFKNVLLLFVAFSGSGALPISSHLFINLAAGLFILPFFLFSASAGVLADKYEKSWFIRKVKLIEIAIMCLGAIGFITESYLVLLLMLFLMGTQSAVSRASEIRSFAPATGPVLARTPKTQASLGQRGLSPHGESVSRSTK